MICCWFFFDLTAHFKLDCATVMLEGDRILVLAYGSYF